MILITGANGFIGRSVVKSLVQSGHSVIATSRQSYFEPNNGGTASSFIPIAHLARSIDDKTDWQADLLGVQTVVHCAARVHIMHDTDADISKAYRDVNVSGTLSLAKQAAVAGVKRFVFLSTVGINGNQSQLPFTETDHPNPKNVYSRSKLEAEMGLFELAAKTGLEVVIIRPPLVYGPNSPGNFARLVRWVKSGVPLPLGAANNKRSFIALDNLVSLVLLCADRMRSMQAANQVFMVSDCEDVSVSSFLRKVALAANCPSRLVPIQPGLLRVFAGLLGKDYIVESLFNNLQVDTTKVRNMLGWQPVVTIDQQLTKIFDSLES